MGELGLELRVGIHCGEVELREYDVSGLAVVIAHRTMSAAQAGEVLASATVKDLVLGSEIEFVSVGEHDLKGVPTPVHLYRVVA
jgi:class 3 adenylate cyclase